MKFNDILRSGLIKDTDRVKIAIHEDDSIIKESWTGEWYSDRRSWNIKISISSRSFTIRSIVGKSIYGGNTDAETKSAVCCRHYPVRTGQGWILPPDGKDVSNLLYFAVNIQELAERRGPAA